MGGGRRDDDQPGGTGPSPPTARAAAGRREDRYRDPLWAGGGPGTRAALHLRAGSRRVRRTPPGHCRRDRRLLRHLVRTDRARERHVLAVANAWAELAAAVCG